MGVKANYYPKVRSLGQQLLVAENDLFSTPQKRLKRASLSKILNISKLGEILVIFAETCFSCFWALLGSKSRKEKVVVLRIGPAYVRVF